MNALRNLNGLSNLVAVSCQGNGRERAGGLACFWKDSVEANIMFSSLNHIDMMIKIGADEREWRCTCIYGFPEGHAKRRTCELINNLANAVDCPCWLVCGDFNLVLSQEEKMGRNMVPLGHNCHLS